MAQRKPWWLWPDLNATSLLWTENPVSSGQSRPDGSNPPASSFKPTEVVLFQTQLPLEIPRGTVFLLCPISHFPIAVCVCSCRVLWLCQLSWIIVLFTAPDGSGHLVSLHNSVWWMDVDCISVCINPFIVMIWKVPSAASRAEQCVISAPWWINIQYSLSKRCNVVSQPNCLINNIN